MGNPGVTFLGHATVLVDLGGVRVLTDPLLHPRIAFLRRVAPGYAPFADADVVVISHLHHDHCDLRSLRQLAGVPVLVPRGAGAWLRDKGVTGVTEIAVGETWSDRGLTITAVPAAHSGYRVPFGPRAQALGYLFERAGAAVYFAGDTDIFEGMSDIRSDIALIPVWGWGPNLGPGHLSPTRAAEAVGLLRPGVAVPIHWGTYYPIGLSTVAPRRRHVLHRPPRDFADEVARLHPDVTVAVTEPGRVVTVGGGTSSDPWRG